MIDAMQWFQLNGKKAMVTGGAAGLCYAMAEGLHLAGAEVVLVDRSPAVGEAAARLGAQGAPVHGVQGDLSHWEGIPALYDRALAALGGRVDILVNGAGIQYRCPAEDFPPERWQQILRINLDAVFRLAQLAGRTMLAQGGGRIINVASMTSFFGSEQIPAYAASKGAVAQLTKALSNEWAGRGGQCQRHRPGIHGDPAHRRHAGEEPRPVCRDHRPHPHAPVGPAGGPPGGGGLPSQPGGGLCHRRHPAGGRRLSGKIRIHRNFRAIPLIHAKKE